MRLIGAQTVPIESVADIVADYTDAITIFEGCLCLKSPLVWSLICTAQRDDLYRLCLGALQLSQGAAGQMV